jgi:hypothetical protein
VSSGLRKLADPRRCHPSETASRGDHLCRGGFRLFRIVDPGGPSWAAPTASEGVGRSIPGGAVGPIENLGALSAGPCRRAVALTSGGECGISPSFAPMAVFSAHTASPPQTRTPARLTNFKSAGFDSPREQPRPMAHEFGLHHELVLIDRSGLRMESWSRDDAIHHVAWIGGTSASRIPRRSASRVRCDDVRGLWKERSTRSGSRPGPWSGTPLVRQPLQLSAAHQPRHGVGRCPSEQLLAAVAWLGAPEQVLPPARRSGDEPR